MLIGFCLPQFGAMGAAAGAVSWFAQEAEDLGADSLWAGDRLLAPVWPVIGYAGSSQLPEEFRVALDPFAVLTAAAMVTSRALLGTSVLNAPFYSPALLARSLTTIDVLSGGRLLPGLGAGWSPDEFQAVGVPMAERGERLDECLDVLDAFWSSDPAAHKGKYFEIPEFHAGLKPVQQPRPPVYLGGRAPAALRRVANRADGWLPSATLPGSFDPAALAGTLAELRTEAARAGRPEPDAILRFNLRPPTTAADVVAAIARAEREAGIGHVLVDLMYLAGDVNHALDLAGQILSSARSRLAGVDHAEQPQAFHRQRARLAGGGTRDPFPPGRPALPVVVLMVELDGVEGHVADEPHSFLVAKAGPEQVVDRPGEPGRATTRAVEQVGVEGDDVTRLGLDHDVRPLGPVRLGEAGRCWLSPGVGPQLALVFGQVGAREQAQRSGSCRARLQVGPQGQATDGRAQPGVPGRIAGEAGGDTDRRHGRAAEQFGRREECPLIVGDEQLAERGAIHRQRQVVAADPVGLVGLGVGLGVGAPERVGQRGCYLIMQRCRLGLTEQAAQREVPERVKMQNLLVREHGERLLVGSAGHGWARGGQEVHEQFSFIGA